jgi:hypothetical protein
MAKSNFSLSDFVSSIRSDSLARTNRFEVLLPSKPGSRAKSNLVSLMCEQAQLPALTIATRSQKIFGPTRTRPVSSEYGGSAQFVFHVDRDMRIKEYFDDWVHTVISPTNFTVNYQRDYASSIFVRQLDEQDNITYEIELIEAFPVAIGQMDLNHLSSNQTHRLPVNFSYRYWVDTSKGYNSSTAKALTAISRLLTTPGIPVIDNLLGRGR